MGYFSDVRVILNKEDFVNMKTMLTNENSPLAKFDVLDEIDNGKYVYFGWNYIKWGLDCLDLESWLKDREEFHFVRMGEYMDDYDDVWYLPNCETSIVVERKFVE